MYLIINKDEIQRIPFNTITMQDLIIVLKGDKIEILKNRYGPEGITSRHFLDTILDMFSKNENEYEWFDFGEALKIMKNGGSVVNKNEFGYVYDIYGPNEFRKWNIFDEKSDIKFHRASVTLNNDWRRF